MSSDYYALLGVSSQASEDEIKRAYRKIARQLHPDTNGGDKKAEERFKEVTVAYETLKDPEKRRRYDMYGPEGSRGSASSEYGNPFGAGFGDIFETFFGGGSGNPFSNGANSAASYRGQDIEVNLDIAFEEAVFGSPKELTLRMPVTCSTCSGSGARAGTSPTRCSVCGGSGEIRRVRQSLLGQMVTASPCSRCGGTGEIIEQPCESCRGEGRRTEERTFNIEVPPGVDSGSTLRLSGKGAAAPRKGVPGDLYVHLRVAPNKKFSRNGFDLIHKVSIAMTQAALGAVIEIETLDGQLHELHIPPSTQTGRTFRLKGLGVPHLQSKGRGDLIVEIIVETPTPKSEVEEQLLRQLASIRQEDVAEPESGFFSKIRSAFK